MKKMKKIKKGLAFALCVLLIVGMSCTAAFADTFTTGSAVVPISGGGIQVDMSGSVTPTILSVTLPANIVFEIGKSNEGENKVLSPRVPVSNGSSQGVYIYAQNTQVDMSQMGGAVYVPSTSGGSLAVTAGGFAVSGGGFVTSGSISVMPNEIAVGFTEEQVPTYSAVMPGLGQARWLIHDPNNYTWMNRTQLAYIPGNGATTLHVVGTLGNDVPEGGTFTVRPTIIASYQPLGWW